MTSSKRHLVHRAEVVHPDDVLGVLEPFAIWAMGIEDVLEAKTHVGLVVLLDFAQDALLEREVLEHGLDDDVGVLQAGVVGRRR